MGPPTSSDFDPATGAPSTPAFIGVDWGTTSLRAYLVDRDGRILSRKAEPRGILAVPEGRFGEALHEAIGSWLSERGPLPIVLSGMISSRNGWVEVPYVACPASLDSLVGKLHRMHVEGSLSAFFVPGLSWSDPSGPDVMRGEETQILGAMREAGIEDGVFVLPGTHSKWVRCHEGRIESFSTFMTGEVFAALKEHTILGRSIEGAPGTGSGFRQGVEAAAAEGAPGDLLRRLFKLRTLELFRRLPRDEAASYLSGLLIGSEIMANVPAGAGFPATEGFMVIADAALGEAYAEAARLLGLSARRASPDCVVAGQAAIAGAAGLF